MNKPKEVDWEDEQQNTDSGCNHEIKKIDELYYKNILDSIIGGLRGGDRFYGSWSRSATLSVLKNSDIEKCLYPGYNSMEVGSWDHSWETPENLQKHNSLIRLSVGNSCESEDKLERLKELGKILSDAGAILYVDEKRLYIVADRVSLPSVLVLITR